MSNFKSFYDVLEEALKGKKVRLRSYECNDWQQYKYTGDPVDGGIIGWNEKQKYHEWTGTVKEILQNDNSHVDIVFDTNQPHTKSSPELYDHAFNWHMGDYIEILD